MATLTEKDIAKIRRRLKWSAVLLNDEDPLSNVLNTVRADVEKLLAHNDAKDEIIAEQSAQIARMDEALKVFANVADQYSELEDDDFQVLSDMDVLAPRLLLSHFRAARRAALTKAGTGERP